MHSTQPQIANPTSNDTLSSHANTLPALGGITYLRMGRVLAGRYRLECVLGYGAMGEVYRALDLQQQVLCAVKLVLPGASLSLQAHPRLQQESKVVAYLYHPNIVEVRDYGDEPDGTHYLVMELLEGSDLRTLLAADVRLPWPRARPIALSVGAALQYAHQMGVVHRDINPNNIFVSQTTKPDGSLQETVKVLDFGLAKFVDAVATNSESAQLTKGMVIGTPAYVPPEAGGAYGGVSGPSRDQWSLAVVLYRMLSGRLPFERSNVFQLYQSICHEDPPPLRELVPGLPPHVYAAVHRALSKEPQARFATIKDFLRALEGLPPLGPSVALSGVSPLKSELGGSGQSTGRKSGSVRGEESDWPAGPSDQPPLDLRTTEASQLPDGVPASTQPAFPSAAFSDRLQPRGGEDTTGPHAMLADTTSPEATGDVTSRPPTDLARDLAGDPAGDPALDDETLPSHAGPKTVRISPDELARLAFRSRSDSEAVPAVTQPEISTARHRYSKTLISQAVPPTEESQVSVAMPLSTSQLSWLGSDEEPPRPANIEESPPRPPSPRPVPPPPAPLRLPGLVVGAAAQRGAAPPAPPAAGKPHAPNLPAAIAEPEPEPPAAGGEPAAGAPTRSDAPSDSRHAAVAPPPVAALALLERLREQRGRALGILSRIPFDKPLAYQSLLLSLCACLVFGLVTSRLVRATHRPQQLRAPLELLPVSLYQPPARVIPSLERRPPRASPNRAGSSGASAPSPVSPARSHPSTTGSQSPPRPPTAAHPPRPAPQRPPPAAYPARPVFVFPALAR